MVSRYDQQNNKILNYAVNACLAPICSLHGQAVTTVEGIGSLRKGLHPIQERLAKFHGSQCGFCTPGFVMSMYALLRNQPVPSMKDITQALEGNLCRCTGYRPILDGFHTFSQCDTNKNQCCRREVTVKKQVAHVFLSSYRKLPSSKIQRVLWHMTPLKTPYFPQNYRWRIRQKARISYSGPRVTWCRPASLSALLKLKTQHPEENYSMQSLRAFVPPLRAIVPSLCAIAGRWNDGIEMRIKNMLYPVLISVNHLPELRKISCLQDGVQIGAAVTLSDLLKVLETQVDKLPEYKTRIFLAIAEMLRWFAGKQIRNVACVGGNIMTASPISDLNPLFCAAGVKLTAVSADRGKRDVKMDDSFFTGYRRTSVKEDEILMSVFIPHTQKHEYFQGFKQSHRRDDDIAIVNSGFRARFQANTDVVDDVTLAFGGMGPTTVIAQKTANNMIGRRWEDSLLTDVVSFLTQELELASDAPGGMVNYRRTLAISFFYKFYLKLRISLDNNGTGINGNRVQQKVKSATLPFPEPTLLSTQVFEQVSTDQNPMDPVGRPLIHQSAYKQATGEAIYIDDMPRTEGELQMCLVVSLRANARLVSVDTSTAVKLPGVVDYIDHRDAPSENVFGFEGFLEIFATEQVYYEGQIVGAILADTQEHALVASKAVKIQYEEQTAIVSIQDAIRHQSFFPVEDSVGQGDPETAFSQCDHVMEGEVQGGGQEHFYMETQSCLVVPKEGNEMEVFVSSQNPSQVQKNVADALGVQRSKIVCKTKRLGGGFGGKEYHPELGLIPAAIAAHKHGVPVRCCLGRQEDMMITGGRHPYYAKYKVGFRNDGRVMALWIDFYLNGGNVLESSASVLLRALHSIECCYNFPNFVANGRVCRTNLPSNTAFRGFGSPQAMLVTESILTDMAVTLGITQNQVREINMYKLTERSYCNMPMDECSFRQCWDLVLHKVNFEKKRDSVRAYNRANRWKKRGISIIPVKWPIGIFDKPALNQGGALVHVYTDGSVLLTCGGTEMGQGLHTKMIQVASRVLGIPSARIIISETSTNTVPNTSATSASQSSDINGFAVKEACEKILRRLQPIIDANPEGGWDNWVQTAYEDRVSLSATGYYCVKYLDYDKRTNTGRFMSYYTCGAGFSEVEIDCLTGDHQLLRTEIVMDVGKSLNPAIDIGQIEGGFMQGYGLVALEQCKVTPGGHVLTTGPGTYKIPSVGNIPAEFNVTLLKGGTMEKAVYSSRGIGEPPLGLAVSVFFAIKDAIMASRADNGESGVFRLDSPATPERIRMACTDSFTQTVQESSNLKEDSPKTPWFITP
ncbi:LOW QUALITY PROTEIN: xanthine dehydrogenase/oxidase-like [Liolophura sinensis]|uniref:LOW QUALITY PROTEIN: xanthine dehydrogenase/oxidase-like n=1 Tax=Liolophura sinensis TaxID=3198878 RepID=UPI0031588675